MAAAGIKIDAVSKAAQAQASDPSASAWVSANAGTGKTFVLARRVVRLLLAGADPGRILCLTFTKAAAAQMATGVFDTLRDWATLPDRALASTLADIEGRAPAEPEIARARRLFARALDTPGGLKIQTIHAFCERLLHQFPFEANVAGTFEVLDAGDGEVLAELARREVLGLAARDPDGPLGAALATVLANATDFAHETAIAAFIRERDRVRAWTTAHGSLDDALDALRRRLGLATDDTPAVLRAAILDDSALAPADIARLVEMLRQGGKADNAAADRLAPFLDAADDDDRIDACLAFFLKADGGLRVAGTLVTGKVKGAWPDLADMLAAESARLAALLDRLAAADCFATTAALVRLADAAIGAYDRMKLARGALDFDDLVVKTANLLARADASQWVHYKLDRGIEHILVDEAQDTNPRQWQVIRALCADFFAGAGASEATRTLFAVGDRKQSIFSFQGAVPAWFSIVERDLGKRAREAGLAWYDPQLHLSFRSVQPVLSAVDAVFADAALRAALSGEGVAPVHTAARHRDPGRVVVWPMIDPDAKLEPADWTTPLDHLGAASPEVKLARRVARTIARWIHYGERLDTGEPIRPGGILILNRTRGAQTDALNRALKSQGIPIAGADRLTLTDHIAVMDLMALGRVMLLPEDDLSLAALVKSPLIGLDEDDLYALARDRVGTLWEALAALAARGGRAGEALAQLRRWQAFADDDAPHAFFARILGPERGRLKITRRLGAEAEDVLDEFLAQALAYERTGAPTLQGFLAWLEGNETEIKRDTETIRDEVRVMTVHGAKGLEADIVFVVDNGMAPVIFGHDPKVVALDDEHDGAPSPLVWMRRLKDMPPVVQARIEALREQSYEEYLRLLYVAMTRARDRLYVCGTRKERATDNERGWHGLVTRALGPECATGQDADGETELEWRAPARTAPAARRPHPDLPLGPRRPDWLDRDAPPPPPALTRLVPSALAGDDDFGGMPGSVVGGDGDAAAALERGRLGHRLLQSLPDIDPGGRQAAGARYLAAAAAGWPPRERDQLLAEVMAVLDNADFAGVFAPASRAEVDIAGRIERAGEMAVVAGRVDRLAVTADRVLIVDYKTNRPAPGDLQSVPPAYIGQLAVYRALLRRLYPDREVAAALLWTDIPRLMEIPPEALAAAEEAIRGGSP
jgi:ATP-dependent helicase/nuclease subunit A